MLDLGKVATLREVVARGSFSAAAGALALTQPAVSRQVSLLERQLGTQLLLRTRRGVQPTEAGRLLLDHAEVILGRLATAEQQLAELRGLRRGEVRLGSFFTALVYLSAEVGGLVQARHPELTIKDELVDRRTALRKLAAGELDVAIVFEHDFEPVPAPADVELVALFDDPVRALVPAQHVLARRRSLRLGDLADETWIRAHDGSAARLVDLVLRTSGLQPEVMLAGRGDEPVEAQAFVAAGKGIALAHDLNVVIDPAAIAVRPLVDEAPLRHIQAAIMRDQRAPATRAVLDALTDVGRERTRRLGTIAEAP
jgi:DNA-binding transcriptional LysR family regulator